MIGYVVVDTAFGACALAWSDRGIVASTLPEGSRQQAAARIRRRHPDAVEAAPPATVAAAVEAVVALVEGRPAHGEAVELDDADLPDWDRRVYAATRAVPAGRTVTYGDIARALDAPGGAQAVGQALGRNPFPPIVPCHRVLAAAGEGGFSGPGGLATKRRLLVAEGALADQPALF